MSIDKKENRSEIDIYVINKIKEKRIELGLSQRDIASTLDCSNGFIGQIESDNYTVRYSVHQVYLLAKAFKCSPADFFPPIKK